MMLVTCIVMRMASESGLDISFPSGGISAERNHLSDSVSYRNMDSCH